MEYEINNITTKARYCHDLLIKAGEKIKTESEDVLKAAKICPAIFEIEQVKIKQTKNKGE